MKEKIELDLNNPIMIVYYPHVGNITENEMLLKELKEYFDKYTNITFWYLLHEQNFIKVECVYQGSYVNKPIVDIFEKTPIDNLKEVMRDYKISEILS